MIILLLAEAENIAVLGTGVIVTIHKRKLFRAVLARCQWSVTDWLETTKEKTFAARKGDGVQHYHEIDIFNSKS